MPMHDDANDTKGQKGASENKDDPFDNPEFHPYRITRHNPWKHRIFKGLIPPEANRKEISRRKDIC